MKNLIALLIVATTATFAHARPIQLPSPEQEFSFDLIQIAEDSSVFQMSNYVDFGHLAINDLAGQLTLTIHYKPIANCPAGAMCFVGPIQVPDGILTLPIVSSTTNRCGTVVTIAEHDMRPADGNLNRLQVVDHTYDTCLFQPMDRPVIVTVLEQTAREGKTMVSTLQGSSLMKAF